MGSDNRQFGNTNPAAAEEENPTAAPYAANPNVTSAALRGANVARQRNVLGRGLQALMSSSAVPIEVPTKSGAAISVAAGAKYIETPAAEPLEGGLIYLSLDRVFANKAQPRQHFSPEEINQLSQSIGKTGLLQPIVVRRRSVESGPLASYEIVAGERRFRAAKQAGLVKIPAILKHLTDREALELGLIENVQRADLNPLEEAQAYQRLMTDYGATQADVAETVGKDRASVANSLRLLKLPEKVQKELISKAISAGHGRALLGLESAEAQIKLCARIINEGLSVRAVEEIVGGEKATAEKSSKQIKSKTAKPPKAPSLFALEEQLRRSLGTKVSLSMNEKGEGEIRVQFYSRAELERILEKIGD